MQANTGIATTTALNIWVRRLFAPSREDRFRMELQTPDEETMVRVAVADLDDRFASIDRPRIESTVRRVVRAWLTGARVKTYVGIIAERHARAELEQIQSEPRRSRDR